MKTLVLLLPLLSAALAYTHLNDNDIVDTRLTDKAKARQETQDLTSCLVDGGPCKGLNAAAKPHVAQALADSCAGCGTVQKRGAIKFLKSLKNDFPDLWAKFDPDRTKYDNMIKILSGLE